MRKIALILCFAILGVSLAFSAVKSWGAVSSVQKKETRIFLGMATEFPPGTVKALPKYKMIVFSDSKGLYAVSSVCTHMGCTVSYKANEGLLACPCHGAKYSKDGTVTHGPAKKNLKWFLVEIDPGNKVYIDLSKTVPQGTKVNTKTGSK
jgi:cytochrome b6-f complex iron-sulfur subunit